MALILYMIMYLVLMSLLLQYMNTNVMIFNNLFARNTNRIIVKIYYLDERQSHQDTLRDC